MIPGSTSLLTSRHIVNGVAAAAAGWRGIATRCEKTTTVYLVGLHLAGLSPWSAR